MTFAIWGAVTAFYLLFLLWYVNWRGPLSQAEIDAYLSDFPQGSGGSNTDRDDLRAFLEADDGKEFVMLNLVKLYPGDLEHPDTGEKMSGSELLSGYTRRFIRALIGRGGHPVFMARKMGGYIDSWNCPQDPEWTMAAMMRYRSRRDLMALATAPQFGDGHRYKLLAIEQTISFPTQFAFSLALRPKITVPLFLITLGLAAQLAV